MKNRFLNILWVLKLLRCIHTEWTLLSKSLCTCSMKRMERTGKQPIRCWHAVGELVKQVCWKAVCCSAEQAPAVLLMEVNLPFSIQVTKTLPLQLHLSSFWKGVSNEQKQMWQTAMFSSLKLKHLNNTWEFSYYPPPSPLIYFPCHHGVAYSQVDGKGGPPALGFGWCGAYSFSW